MKNFIGNTIDHYQILLKIRETGTRILFKVYDTNTRRNLALEVIKGDNLSTAELPILFDLLNSQAQKNAGLIHSNIAAVIDSGFFDGTPYFVYNFSPFQPIRRLFNQKYSWHDTSRQLVAITQAVSYAHENGVIHGFLSPANIILDENKNPYLFDFGFEQIILKFLISHLPGSWINNSDYAYCSPEQLSGISVDERSDVYSMGLILFEWMTGKIALLEDSALGTLYKRLIPPENNIQLRNITAPEIRDIVQKCISTNPENRYQSMQELSVLLARSALEIKITTKMVNKPLDIQPVGTKNPWRRIAFFMTGVLTLLAAIIVSGKITAHGFTQVATTSSSSIPSITATLTLIKATSEQTSIKVTPLPENDNNQSTQIPNSIQYPILEGTRLPLGLDKISTKNSSRLVTLDRWGIGELNQLISSSDGNLLAAASPLGIFLYNSDDFSLIKYIDTSSWIKVIAFSPDGKKMAAGDKDGLIIVWETQSWKQIENLSGHQGEILDLVFSPDSSQLTSIGSDNKLIEWNSRGEPVSTFVKDVACVEYSPDGSEIITGGNDFKINFWNSTSLSLIKTITHSAKVTALNIVNSSNELIIGGSDRSVIIINMGTFEKSIPFNGLKNSLSSIQVSPDGLIIAASDIYGGIVAWDHTGKILWDTPTRINGFVPSDNVVGKDHSLAFSANGKILISGYRNGVIRQFDVLTGQELNHSFSLANFTEKLVVSNNSNFVISQNNSTELRMWDLRSGKLLYEVTGTIRQGGVFSSNDQYFAVAVDDTTVKMYKTLNGEEVFKFNGLQNIQTIQFVQNDRFLVAGNDPTMRLWSTTSGQEIITSKNFDGTGCTVAYDLKGDSIFSFTKYHYVPKNGKGGYFCAFQKADWMKALSINEINSDIVYGGSNKLGFFGSNGESNEMVIENHNYFNKVAINSDSTLIAAALDDNSIGIWDTQSKKIIMKLFGSDHQITDLQFTPDGIFLVSSSQEGTIRVWGIP